MRGIIPLVALAVLAGCGPSYSPDTYASSAVQQANKVEQGVVVGVRKVAVDASGATGAVTGAAAGGIAGSQAPGGTVSTALGALGGSLVGGLIGSGVERAAGDTFAYEYVVRKPNNELISVTQRDPAPLALGQHVLVIAGAQARIVPDYTVPTDPPTTSAQAPASAPPRPPPAEPAPPSPTPEGTLTTAPGS
jgi:outer membrane lipoprotein SlyB